MNLFIYELVSAGGLGSSVAPSLRREGWAMLSAIVEDFSRVSGILVDTLLDHQAPGALGHRCHRTGPNDEPQAFRIVVRHTAASIIIAPEFGGMLEARSQMVLEEGRTLLGCSPAAIRATADKLTTFHHLGQHGVPTIPTLLVTDGTNDVPFPCVIKPRDGAGSQATFLVENRDEWVSDLRQAKAELPKAELIVQPFHPGRPASVALLVGPKQTLTTPGAWQRMSNHGRFQYLGGRTPLPSNLRHRAIELASYAVEGVPGLQGFVGVDVILGEAADGTDDVVVEINPRLTTSYIGLRCLTRTNLAEVWWRIMQGEIVDEPSWDAVELDFDATGNHV